MLGLSREQTRAFLGLSLGGLRHCVERNELTPWRDKSGVWRFDPEEVAKLCRARAGRQGGSQGEMAAHAFAMFQSATPFEDVVMRLEQPPHVIRRLYRDYLTGFDREDRALELDEPVFKKEE